MQLLSAVGCRLSAVGCRRLSGEAKADGLVSVEPEEATLEAAQAFREQCRQG